MEIQTNTDGSRWNLFPGKKNPADLLTRGISVTNLQTNKLWWDGPSWLRKCYSEWPHHKPKYDSKSAEVEESIGALLAQPIAPIEEHALYYSRLDPLDPLQHVYSASPLTVRNSA